MPYKLSLSITNKCNSRCLICNVWQAYKLNPPLQNKELSVGEWELFFKKNGKHFFWAAITGGEPFLRDDLVTIVKLCMEHCPNLLVLSIVSNGLDTEIIPEKMREIVEINRKVKIYLVVSVDGEESVHDHLRQTKGGFQKVLRTIGFLEKLAKTHKNFNLRLETVISKFNLEHCGQFLDSELVKNHEISFAFVQEAKRYFNQGTGIALQDTEPEKIKPLLGQLIKSTKVNSLESLILKIFYQLSQRFFYDSKHQVIPCFASFASVFIGPYGEVRPCVMMEETGLLKEYGFDLKKLMDGQRMRQLKEMIINEQCPNCWTPCEAMQTIMQNFFTALFLSNNANIETLRR